MRRLVAGLVLALALAGAAAAQPAKEHAEFVAELGGVYQGPQARYVSQIGQRMAQAAGIRQRCSFTVLDTEVVNAFTAPPGCYVYVTRGLLSIMNSEAELAAVLGHELGHVAASHAQRQQNAEALSGLAASLIGAATKSDVVGAVAGRVAKLGTLSYSRSQEYEADALAIRYLPQAGYAPDGLTRVLGDLQREDAYTTRVRGKSGGTPVWARTHPLTTDRITRAQAAAAASTAGGPLLIEETAYLLAVDGMPYDDDPVQGLVRGGAYIHPALRIRFDAPRGFAMANEPEAVRVTGPEGMLAEFSGGTATVRQLPGYAENVLRAIIRQGRSEMGVAQRTTINGMEAVVLEAHAFSGGRPVDLICVAYNLGGDETYHFVAMAPAGRLAAFQPMFDSFRRLPEREAAAVAGRRIAVVTVRAGDTAETLAGRMAGEGNRLELFRMLNGLEPGAAPRPGSQVKLVVDGRP
jgi:predicted Zn-dependent protease